MLNGCKRRLPVSWRVKYLLLFIFIREFIWELKKKIDILKGGNNSNTVWEILNTLSGGGRRTFRPHPLRRPAYRCPTNWHHHFHRRFYAHLYAWQFPTLAWGDPTLPSALRRFTSEFGMGSGGTTALRPPGKFCFIRPLLRSDLICIRLKIFSHPPKHLRRCKVKPHGSLVPVSSTHRCAYTPGLSTSSSSTFLQDSQRSQGELISGQVSCLDAFSTYLFRI